MESILIPEDREPRANALKHGLRASDELLAKYLYQEDRDSFSTLRQVLTDHHNPQTDVEKLIVDRIVMHHFRLFKLYRIEYLATTDSSKFPLASNSVLQHLDRFSRYDSRIAHQIKSLEQALTTVQRNRTSNTTPTES